MKIFNVLIIAAAILISHCSCTVEPAEPSDGHNITGTVKLFNESGDEIDNANMVVTVNEVSSTSAQSDALGQYTLEDLPNGTYSLSFAKEGFGTYIKYGVSHVADTTTIIAVPTPLGELSNTKVTYLYSEQIDYTQKIAVTTSPMGSITSPRYIRLFFSTQYGVSYTNYEGYSEIQTLSTSPGIIDVTREQLLNMGFVSGEEIFVKAYGESIISNIYTDASTGKEIFPNINKVTSDEISFDVP